MQLSVASDLGLHCLPVNLLGVSRLKWVIINIILRYFSGQIPVVQLNYAALSFESPYDRDVVENCVREILGAVQRAVGAKKNVELTFHGIGRLQIRDSKVKMKFYKEFITHMDGSGKLLDSLQNVSSLFLLSLPHWYVQFQNLQWNHNSR